MVRDSVKCIGTIEWEATGVKRRSVEATEQSEGVPKRLSESKERKDRD